jgi:hypothetical protein
MTVTSMEPGSNLTFTSNILRSHTADALEGHTVVVFEKTGTAGESFRYQLRPGQTPPKQQLNLIELFRSDKSGPTYFAFAVTDHPELRTSTTTAVTTDDQKHSFSATISAAFRVEEPRLVVARRNDDPLQKLQTEIGAVVARELAQRDWDDLRNRFRQTEEDVVPKALPQLRRFAFSYGFYIESLSLTCHLGEQDLRLIDQEREAELVTERKKIELQQLVDLRSLEARVKAQERQDLVFNAAAEAAAKAIRNVPESIHTVAELAKSFDTFARYSGNGGEFTRRLLEEAGEAGENGTGAGAVLAEMLLETEKLSWRTVDQKRRAQSAMLHLIAELLLEDPDEDVVETLRKRVTDQCASLSTEEAEKVQRFSDPEIIRSQLS